MIPLSRLKFKKSFSLPLLLLTIEVTHPVIAAIPEGIETFETGDLSGWAASGAVTVFSEEQLSAMGYTDHFTNGKHTVIFGEGNSAASGVISKDFATVPGQKSVLAFDFGTASPNKVGPQTLEITITDVATATKLRSWTVIDSRGEPSLAKVFNTYALRFTPTGATTRLTFQDTSIVTHHVDGFLDNISVTETSPTIPQLYTLKQPLDIVFNERTLKEHMDGILSGQCVYGGYCARTSSRLAHNGVTFTIPKNTPVYAICDGKVRQANKRGALAKRFTVIDHSSGCGLDRLFAYYGHINPTVKTGDSVIAGQVIGKVAPSSTRDETSQFHLSLNKSKFRKVYGYSHIKKATPKNCKSQSVLTRRSRLDEKGWLDPTLIALQSDWVPMLLKGGFAKKDCNATEQAYTETTLPFPPWQ